MMDNNRIQARSNTGMMMRAVLCAALLMAHGSFLISSVMAQGMVTEIKVLALNDEDSIAYAAKGYTGYSGTDDLYKDFRKGRGGGYVFVVSQNSTDTASYITKVTVDKRDEYGIEFTSGGYKYIPVPYYQAYAHKDKDYRGGLNGRNYSIYGGSYDGQHHIYVSHTGNKDFNTKVLRSIRVTASKPKDLDKDETSGGGYAGGGRYLVFKWHTHVPKFRCIDDINWHERYCDLDQCGLTEKQPHRFTQLYGNDLWMQLSKKNVADTLPEKSHYKKCLDCGQIVYDDHKWATYSSDWKSHNKRCLICDYVTQAGHANFGKEQIPVDEYYHMIYCSDCQFMQKIPHNYGDKHFQNKVTCESTVLEYRCKQCYHVAYFETTGVGHNYNAYGICTRPNCLHPYKQPDVETSVFGGDSVYVIKSFGNLYWISDHVNRINPSVNIRLDADLIAEDFIQQPWRPIGAADSTAFRGTFDGDGHVISMLQTEEPVAGCGYRGLFGAIAKEGTVKNVAIAGFNMRGWDYIGAVAGINQGTIDSCHVVFSVMSTIGTGKNLGGICGLNKGTISQCQTENNVWVGGVRDYAGGICGTNDGGTLSGNTTQAICGSGSDAILPEAASQQ